MKILVNFYILTQDLDIILEHLLHNKCNLSGLQQARGGVKLATQNHLVIHPSMASSIAGRGVKLEERGGCQSQKRGSVE